MSHSWTSKLQSVSLSGFTLVDVKNLSPDWFIDGHCTQVPPGYMFKDNEALAIAYDKAALYHNMYMAAACDYYSDYFRELKSVNAQYALGYLCFTKLDDMRNQHKVRVPLMLVSSSRVINNETNEEGRASVRGLFAGCCMLVNVQDDPAETKSTLVHESFHSLVASLPDLKEEMYGGDAATQREEIAAHIITDKLSILKSIDEIAITQAVASYEEKKSDWKLVTHSIGDISLRGKSLITARKTIDLKANKADVESYKLSRRRYFEL